MNIGRDGSLCSAFTKFWNLTLRRKMIVPSQGHYIVPSGLAIVFTDFYLG